MYIVYTYTDMCIDAFPHTLTHTLSLTRTRACTLARSLTRTRTQLRAAAAEQARTQAQQQAQHERGALLAELTCVRCAERVAACRLLETEVCGGGWCGGVGLFLCLSVFPSVCLSVRERIAKPVLNALKVGRLGAELASQGAELGRQRAEGARQKKRADKAGALNKRLLPHLVSLLSDSSVVGSLSGLALGGGAEGRAGGGSAGQRLASRSGAGGHGGKARAAEAGRRGGAGVGLKVEELEELKQLLHRRDLLS